MANNGSISTNAYSSTNLKLDWYVNSQSVGNNQSSIHWKLSGVRSKSGWVYCQKFQVKINNNIVYDYTGGKIQVSNGTVINEGDFTLGHDNSGNKRLEIYIQGAVYTASVNVSASGSWDLPQIARYSVITGAPNFNDEENPTIYFTNPSNGYFPLQAKLEAGGDIKFITRNIDRYSTSYTFNLTEDERNRLRNLCPNSNTLGVAFTICCMSGNEELSASALYRTMTVVNANPSLNPEVYDTWEKGIQLTGNRNKLIRYHSDPRFNVNASGRKSASISNQGCNGYGGSTGVINYATTGTYNFFATDSRGNTSYKTIYRDLIPYVRLTSNIKARGNVDNSLDIDISGNYFNGSFGAVNNTLAVEYRIKDYGGSWSNWIGVSNSKSGDSYSSHIHLTGKNYQKTYVVQAYAGDKIESTYSPELVVKTEPIFDWSKNDFRINVRTIINQLYINDTRDGNPSPNDLIDYCVRQDFKARETIGLNSNGGFAWVISAKPWADSSGGPAYQIALQQGSSLNEPLVYLRSGDPRSDSWGSWKNIALQSYPVGSIYMSVNSTSPASLFGGSWEKIEGRFLLGTGTPKANNSAYYGNLNMKTDDPYNYAGSTAGQFYHQLTIDEMPSHSHRMQSDWTTDTIEWKPWNPYTNYYQQASETYNNYVDTTSIGNNEVHNNMPPFYTVHMWKRTG